jgi:hypothetical protein
VELAYSAQSKTKLDCTPRPDQSLGCVLLFALIS